jgi:hypothetical protein
MYKQTLEFRYDIIPIIANGHRGRAGDFEHIECLRALYYIRAQRV